MKDQEIKREVRNFYNEIGWQEIADGVYQNAQYEDLRPISREYIHKCHMRVNRHLNESGKFFLDAGSGPIQYPEYLSYSRNYKYRVCLDISVVALIDARKRIGVHGLFVVGDVAHLPFKRDVFDGVVSLHTIHHLPKSSYSLAFDEIWRVMKKGTTAVVVNGWEDSALMNFFRLPVNYMEKLVNKNGGVNSPKRKINEKKDQTPKGTFVYKSNPENLYKFLPEEIDLEIRVWRSVSVRFLRAMIHRWNFGNLFLKLLYQLEEMFPKFFGEKGQYPMLVVRK